MSYSMTSRIDCAGNETMVVDLQELAQRMLADYDARTPGQVFRGPLKLTTVEAYALQAEIARLREQRGENVIGYKIGCTSPTIQQQLGIDEPICARLFDSGCHPCGARLFHGNYANLAIEGELAVRLGRDLPAAPRSIEECQAAIAAVFPVIELHHYVLHSTPPSVVELIANGGMHAGFVVAAEEASPHNLSNLERLSVWIDGECLGRASGADHLNVAIRSLNWLATRLAEHELPFVAGQVILTGSILKLYPVNPGSRIMVDAPALGASYATINS
jgi:2-keto-4-pentenoate hydratase